MVAKAEPILPRFRRKVGGRGHRPLCAALATGAPASALWRPDSTILPQAARSHSSQLEADQSRQASACPTPGWFLAVCSYAGCLWGFPVGHATRARPRRARRNIDLLPIGVNGMGFHPRRRWVSCITRVVPSLTPMRGAVSTCSSSGFKSRRPCGTENDSFSVGQNLKLKRRAAPPDPVNGMGLRRQKFL
jgi:hypothetical protein